MELFFSPFACSLASHITACEGEVPLILSQVILSEKRTADGRDYLSISPKGQVPALRLEDGSLLTESAAVLQFLADRAPASGLLPPPGSRERYEVLEWISFVGTEIHKLCFYPMFAPDAPAEAKSWARALLDRRLAHVAARLDGRTHVVGHTFTIADAHLTWALTLCDKIGVNLAALPALADYLRRMHARPAVAEAIAKEAAVMRPAGG